MATNNKCSNCGGALVFDPQSGELKCTHCEAITDIEDTKVLNDKKFYDESSSIKQSRAKYAQFLCKSCERTHVCTVDTPIERCPSCGDVNLERTVNVEYIPDGIIPFKINYENAMQSYLSWIKKKKWAPNNLKHLARAESLGARYLPIYNYEFKCISNYHGTGYITKGSGENQRKKKIHFSDTRTDIRQNFIESADGGFNSSSLRDFGNYDFGNIMAYRTEYIYGFVASQVNVDLHQSCANMRGFVVRDIENKIKRSLNCQIETFHCSTTFEYIKYNYLYVPIWTNTYKYKNKTYTCYINGQTGKASGTAPKSFWKIFGAVVLGILIVGGLGYLAYHFGLI